MNIYTHLIDLNENAKINDTSLEFHESVDCEQSDTSENPIRRILLRNI